MIKVGMVLFFIGCSTADSEWWFVPLGLIIVGGVLMKIGEHRQNG
jgi:uncharacterized membrane protein YbhN (UPF0104 family)